MEQDLRNTSLSVGKTVRTLLLADKNVTDITTQIIPVAVAPETLLPYVVYRRAELSTIMTKSGYRASDSVIIEALCCAASYSQSIALAEAVRYALERRRPNPEGCVAIRACRLDASEELYEGDAYIQSLNFQITI